MGLLRRSHCKIDESASMEQWLFSYPLNLHKDFVMMIPGV
ncbi:hypothetical protein RUMHYD_02993 [Blautia hydrogenotrophica DSM 10507]|uniref:Uncharacterized protein n=1 Tax=Blautia hydrogenotrophica (strain DSM 10507 / JCM 14656 / S5a33) TaxID=476272 RepID=C0CQ40_BLAHS|nr:hypothetical protein RUMHYD_02993 [Blautia hydrogenotrophica DSM 10507]